MVREKKIFTNILHRQKIIYGGGWQKDKKKKNQDYFHKLKRVGGGLDIIHTHMIFLEGGFRNQTHSNKYYHKQKGVYRGCINQQNIRIYYFHRDNRLEKKAHKPNINKDNFLGLGKNNLTNCYAKME